LSWLLKSFVEWRDLQKLAKPDCGVPQLLASRAGVEATCPGEDDVHDDASSAFGKKTVPTLALAVAKSRPAAQSQGLDTIR
jgi:hypothetical protein